jgi:anti-sigma regulatory factor (Ser/Thr protein kinase)
MTPAGTPALLPETAGLLTTAARETDAHVSDQGLCAVCWSAFPCPRAQLAEFTLSSLAPGAAPWDVRQAAIRQHRWVFPGTPQHVGDARRLLAAALPGCPAADDAVLCLSELAGNSVRHSDSGKPGGTFTVRAEVRDGDCVCVEVADNGGLWQESAGHDIRLHGLGIVRALAADFSRSGDAETGWVVRARFDWAAAQDAGR